MSVLKLILFDAPVCALYCYTGAPMVLAGTSTPRMDGKHQLCEVCSARLNRVKHKHKHGAGHACHPRCKSSKRVVDDAEGIRPVDPPAPPSKKQRRKRSDPGKQQEMLAIPRTKRVSASKPTKPQCSKVAPEIPMRSEAEISALLNATHARRMAIMQSEAAAQGH